MPDIAPVELSTNAADVQVASGTESSFEEELSKVAIGFARMNTVDSPHPQITLHFGLKNDRPVDSSAVANLRQAYRSAGGRNPSLQVMYVGVQPDWLKEGTYTHEGVKAFSELPVAEFTTAAHGHTIEILSGRHRTRSSQEERDDMRQEQARLRADLRLKIDAHIKAGGHQDDAVVLKATQTADDLCASLEQVIQGVVLWKVLFFDIGTCSTPIHAAAVALTGHRPSIR